MQYVIKFYFLKIKSYILFNYFPIEINFRILVTIYIYMNFKLEYFF